MVWLIVAWAVWVNRRLAIWSVVLTWLITQIIKQLYYVPRPFMATPLAGYHSDGSFPSTHTAVAFAAAVGIWLARRRGKWLAIGLAILVGWGRILGQVHTPADVLAGAGIGMLLAGLTSYHSKC